MSELAFLGSVAALYFVLAASPGPNFVVITQAAASRSRSYAIALSAGVSTASVVWAGLAAAGLGVFIARYRELYVWLQVAGGIYLLYLGLTMLRGRRRSATAGAALPGGLASAWRLGLWTNLTNPKSLAFFSSAFATLFSPELPSWVQFAAVGVVGFISLGWNMVVVAAFSGDRVRGAYQQARRWIDVTGGCLLSFFGLRLVFGALADAWRIQRG